MTRRVVILIQVVQDLPLALLIGVAIVILIQVVQNLPLRHIVCIVISEKFLRESGPTCLARESGVRH